MSEAAVHEAAAAVLDENEEALLAAPPGFPSPPRPEAYQGLAGAVVETIAPATEADPVAILAQLLCGAGSVVGRGAFLQIEATAHYPNEFVALVGDTARSRKGSALDHVLRVLSRADPGLSSRTRTGLSSGEGLIWAARDPSRGDEGAADGRLFVVEPELASVLKATGREQSTLSPVLRAAWDSRPLALLTRTAPARASAAHICLIGHITATELARHLSTLEAENGFLNRFVFIACRRHRLLPFGGDPDPCGATELPARLAAALERARRAGQLGIDDDARALWRDLYVDLAGRDQDGLAGALAARAEAHVLRLSMLYALVDGAGVISPQHLAAGLALWDYAGSSIAWLCRSASGDAVAEQVHAALSSAAAGLSRTELRDLFNRNQTAARLDEALHALERAGRARRERRATAGRPSEIWTATGPDAPHHEHAGGQGRSATAAT